eukprot:527103-Hanusia_phi.AAC.1
MLRLVSLPVWQCRPRRGPRPRRTHRVRLGLGPLRAGPARPADRSRSRWHFMLCGAAASVTRRTARLKAQRLRLLPLP